MCAILQRDPVIGIRAESMLMVALVPRRHDDRSALSGAMRTMPLAASHAAINATEVSNSETPASPEG